ncbi:MAG: phosphate signaling complex protein PhoU [Alphaproteobacteria bacterium]|jgi:phosphate transport system protein|nr:phosphate signaling complex protein PhoU [Alphaproteobacteria bacterium]
MVGHIVKSYDKDLDNLKKLITGMMNTNLEQLNLLYDLLSDFSNETQAKVINIDKAINDLDAKIIDESIKIFSLRNPVAYDLRFVFSASHVSKNLERIGDYTKATARYATNVSMYDKVKSSYLEILHILIEMLHSARTAFENMDVELSKKVIAMDEKVDLLYNEMSILLLQKIQILPEKLDEIRAYILIVRNFERIGDHIASCCQYIDFIENNTMIYN